MSSPTQPLHQGNVFTEARSIVVSYYLHLATFSYLIFTPLCFSIIFLPSFLRTIQPILNSYYTISIAVFLAFIYTLLAFSLSVAGIATITYSTHQAFYQTPLSLSTTVKSLSRSFFPLASTILTFLACLVLICIIPLFSVASLLYAIKAFGFEIDYGSYYFFLVCVLASIVVGLFLVFCQLYCTIAGVVAVVESKWGFEPLRKSYYLIREMKFETVTSLFLHGVVNWVFVIGLPYPYLISSHQSGHDLILVAALSLCDAYLILQYLAASTVLYLFCNDLNSESRVQSDNEISDEYTRLAMEDDMLSNESQSSSQVETGNDWIGIVKSCGYCFLFYYSFYNWYRHW